MKNAEASQLMDIASMAALVKPKDSPPVPPPAMRPEVGPSFATSRLTTRAAATPLASAPSERDPRAPLYWIIGGLNVMVLALAAYVVLDQPTMVVQTPSAEPTPVAVASAEPIDEEPERVEPAAEIPGAPEIEQPAAETPATTKARSKPRARDARKPVVTAPEPTKPATKPAATSNELPIECIVDPASCDRGGKKPTTEAQGPKANAPIENLPETLSQIAMRTGFSQVRAAAKACGPKHGAAAGSSVEVKVSIAGGTGSVMAANALGEHAGSALGKCVANALEQAKFERFAKSQIGLKYTVRL
jgi:hypothetical protein